MLMLLAGKEAVAQHFQLETVHDSLSLLTLTTDGVTDTLELHFPVYRYCTADLTADGLEEAVVGVVKPTRFYHDDGRRLFIFKNYGGQIRTLWRGSRIGGKLIDFKALNGIIRCLMRMKDDHYAVADFSMARFGLQFQHFVIDNASEAEARSAFEAP